MSKTNEVILKYGCNPNQKNARIYTQDGSLLPFEVLNGNLGYINILDALNSWQLVKELSLATNLSSAASFKHVSPAGVGVGVPLSDKEKQMYFIGDVDVNSSCVAISYARARGTDRLCSFGDFIALSCECDEITALLIKKEVSDGIIAPSYSKKALEILKQKQNGKYTILKIDKDYNPIGVEKRGIYGLVLEQDRNNSIINKNLFNKNNIVSKNKALDDDALLNLIIATITLKYTQSNSVVYAKNGQTTGVGAGQQSRIHCTRLAGDKSDNWHLRGCDKVLNLKFKEGLPRVQKDNIIDSYINTREENILDDNIWQNYFSKKPEPLTNAEKQEYLKSINSVCVSSDAFFPFADNIKRCIKSGVDFIAETGGSIRDDEVIKMCDKYNKVLIFTNLRLFHH